MNIIVVRHATTAYNEEHLINGQHDDQLSPLGLKQLPGLVEKLKPYNFATIYSSPLKRALQTAEEVSKARDIPIIQDSRIIEVDFGSFTTKSWESTKPVFGLDSKALLDSYTYDFTNYGGESAEQVKKRIEDFLSDLCKLPNQSPLLVTHGGIIRWLYYILKGNKHGVQPNASVHNFQISC